MYCSFPSHRFHRGEAIFIVLIILKGVVLESLGTEKLPHIFMVLTIVKYNIILNYLLIYYIHIYM